MKIQARNRKIFYTEYRMVYRFVDSEDELSFPCNDYGEILYSEMSQDELTALEACKSGELDIYAPEVKEFSKSYVASAIGTCDACGAQVVIDSDVNACSGCSSEYDYHGHPIGKVYLVG